MRSKLFPKIFSSWRRLFGHSRTTRIEPALPPNANLAAGFIFVHIPKTAGTSMCAALGLAETTHATASEFRTLLGAQYEQLFSFAFTRNPWDRFLSLYLYARMEESHHHSAKRPHRKRYGKHPDYDTLRQASLSDAAHLLLEGRLGMHWLPQHRWVCDEQGQIICTFVGQLESLDEQWPQIVAQTKATALVPRKNVANVDKIPYQDRIDDRTKSLLDEYYQRDIELFGYRF
ncbi:MAG: sulfotransferase family 2 domain-containing protein [Planctomycetota bacterium]